MTDLPVLPPLDVRIPKWPLDQLTTRACPLCRTSHEAQFRRPDRLPVAYCDECSVWYVCELPPPAEINRLYQGYWHSFRPKDLSPPYAKLLMSNPRLMNGDPRLESLAALTGGLLGKRVLEIGCGCGEFLVAARNRGAEVFGNDISAEACLFVRDQLRIPVFEGAFDPSLVGGMDVIVMSDLIEHPAEPLELLQAAAEVLNPGGLLLMLTPNGGAASTEWVGFRVDLEHLQYLSMATMSAIAGKVACEVELLETFGYPDLEGLDRPRRSTPRTRSPFHPVTIMKGVLQRWRAHRAPNPKAGNYHLLAILRKQ
jgi:SAM-dependent methyltransferase